MKKAKKILLILVIVLLIFVVVAAIIVNMFLGNIVKAGMETFGPKLTQTTLTVDAVDVHMLAGSAKVKGLVIGNPEGYKAPTAIQVGSAAVSVSPMSVMSDKIVVKYVRVEAPDITFEGNPLGKNNLKQIEDNVNAAAASIQSAPPTDKTGQAAAKPSKKLEVDEFLITGAKVHLGTGASMVLPDIHLTDLGKGSDGITPADLTSKILSEVVSGTITAVLKDSTKLGKGAENLGKQGVNAVKGLGGLFKKSTN
jgi:uncharacterized protein involved in outer membrane biogenesis